MAPSKSVLTLRNIAIATIAVAILAGGYRVWSVRHALATMQTGGIMTSVGPDKAKNVVVEFMDYRCHACRTMAPVMAEFVKNHPDVKVIYRHFPLYAQPSVTEADLALAAALQGKFMPMHTYLLSRDQPVQVAEIPAIAGQLGLDANKLQADMYGHPVTQQLRSTIDAVHALRIDMAPSFLFNGAVYQPPKDIPNIDQLEALFRPYYKKD